MEQGSGLRLSTGENALGEFESELRWWDSGDGQRLAQLFHLAYDRLRTRIYGQARDAGFADSAAKINVEQIFKLLSPATEVKCI